MLIYLSNNNNNNQYGNGYNPNVNNQSQSYNQSNANYNTNQVNQPTQSYNQSNNGYNSSNQVNNPQNSSNYNTNQVNQPTQSYNQSNNGYNSFNQVNNQPQSYNSSNNGYNQSNQINNPNYNTNQVNQSQSYNNQSNNGYNQSNQVNNQPQSYNQSNNGYNSSNQVNNPQNSSNYNTNQVNQPTQSYNQSNNGYNSFNQVNQPAPSYNQSNNGYNSFNQVNQPNSYNNSYTQYNNTNQVGSIPFTVDGNNQFTISIGQFTIIGNQNSKTLEPQRIILNGYEVFNINLIGSYPIVNGTGRLTTFPTITTLSQDNKYQTCAFYSPSGEIISIVIKNNKIAAILDSSYNTICFEELSGMLYVNMNGKICSYTIDTSNKLFKEIHNALTGPQISANAKVFNIDIDTTQGINSITFKTPGSSDKNYKMMISRGLVNVQDNSRGNNITTQILP